MNNLQAYKTHELYGGWTRVEMLLAIYDKAIKSFQAAKHAMEMHNNASYARHFIAGQKAVLAIHAGLKPDEHEVAFNIARLLHFVLTCVEQRNFDDATKILKKMKAGFEAIRTEANQLEASGQIPPVPETDACVVNA